MLDVDRDGSAFVRLSAAEMDMLSSDSRNLLYLGAEEDVILYIGSDAANVDADWERGVFKDNFDGTWPMLDGVRSSRSWRRGMTTISLSFPSS